MPIIDHLWQCRLIIRLNQHRFTALLHIIFLSLATHTNTYTKHTNIRLFRWTRPLTKSQRCLPISNYRTREKIWRGKILANLTNGVQFVKIFHANSYKYSEITEDLPADSPKFSSPFASSVTIRQIFLPPNFSHVRYTIPLWACKEG